MCEIKVRQTKKNKLRNKIKGDNNYNFDRWKNLFYRMRLPALRIILFPFMLLAKVYSWTWDHDFTQHFTQYFKNKIK